MIVVSKEEEENVRNIVEGRDIHTVSTPVVETLKGVRPQPEGKWLDAHDRNNMLLMMSFALTILDEHGNGGQCFGRRFEGSLDIETRKAYNVLINTLARSIKVGIKL